MSVDNIRSGSEDSQQSPSWAGTRQWINTPLRATRGVSSFCSIVPTVYHPSFPKRTFQKRSPGKYSNPGHPLAFLYKGLTTAPVCRTSIAGPLWPADPLEPKQGSRAGQGAHYDGSTPGWVSREMDVTQAWAGLRRFQSVPAEPKEDAGEILPLGFFPYGV